MSKNALPVFPFDILLELCEQIIPLNLVLQQVTRLGTINHNTQEIGSCLSVPPSFQSPKPLSNSFVHFLKDVSRSAISPKTPITFPRLPDNFSGVLKIELLAQFVNSLDRSCTYIPKVL
ncbi:hypothetical protein Smp_194290 [Schistosoma mansoni]|uniref:Uncharacterized protein n=1 Tax=Schistosoma mansoni TaxID=6183 RepID=G4M1S1_SCHMA|nr:hypothetical protein Smp_194290 [Schistosoma mansoni]|eukprot:XP_018647404.1 hypothetical protein Smp_194290 [Schistosoma mansoni]